MSDLPSIPPRPADAHKGLFGRVLVIGGSAGMAGAPALVALAALRSGAGLVQVSCPPQIRPTVAALVPCATITVPDQSPKFEPTVRAVGPGCADQLSQKELTRILDDRATPAVVDADGLNVLATMDRWWNLVHERVVLTPHPGEMARLLASSQLPATGQSREQSAAGLAGLCAGIVVLKGHRTIVRQAQRQTVNDTGNPGMATGGSGDVLTGVIAALIGQGLPVWDAACVGVRVHGLAGDCARRDQGEIGMIATDIIAALPEAFEMYQKSR